MNFTILPLEGVNDIRFGMGVASVRSMMGGVFASFMKTPSSTFPSDRFPEAGMFAYYDADGILEAVELAKPATPMFDEVDLLTLDVESVFALLKSKDGAVCKECDGVFSNGLGVSVYAPHAAKDPSSKCESVVVFRRGYFG